MMAGGSCYAKQMTSSAQPSFNYLRYTQQICVKIHNKMYKRIYLEKRKIMFLKKIYNLIIVRRGN